MPEERKNNMTTIYLCHTGVTDRIKVDLSTEINAGETTEHERTAANFVSYLEAFTEYIEKHEFSDAAFTVDDNLTRINIPNFSHVPDDVDEIFAYDKDGNLFAYHVTATGKYAISATNYGAVFTVEYDVFLSTMGKFTVTGELSQGHRDNSIEANWLTVFADEDFEKSRYFKFPFKTAKPDGVLVLSRSNEFIFKAVAPGEVTPDPPLIGSSGVCWYFVKIPSDTAWYYFINEIYYEDAHHNKIYPISDGSVVAILPVCSANLDFTGWTNRIRYPSLFASDFYEVRASTKEPDYVIVPNDTYTLSHLSTYFGATTHANYKGYALDNPRAVILGAEIPLNIKELTRPGTTKLKITAKLTYQGGLSMYAIIEYIHGNSTFYTDYYTRQIPLCMNILTDEYSAKMLDQRASYYTGLFTDIAASGLSSAGGAVAGFKTGNYFGATQSIASGATRIATAIVAHHEMKGSTDSVNAQGSALTDFLTFGDYILTEPVLDALSLEKKWNLYGYNHLNPMIDSDLHDLVVRPHFVYLRFSQVEIFDKPGVRIAERHKDELRRLFTEGVWVARGTDELGIFTHSANFHNYITQNGGG